MSETKTYKGKFSSLDMTVEEFVEDNLHHLSDYFQDSDNLREKFLDICDNIEWSGESKSKGFFVIDSVVQEISELEDLQYENFAEVDKVSGTFVTSFYDGGTCLQEMLEKNV